MDLVVGVPHLPLPGETVIGGDVERHRGGKGANQAVSAARLGRPTAMIGCVGEDDAGRELLRGLNADGVDTSHVRRLPDVPSGTALIAVAMDGENDIVVSPGANGRVDASLVHDAAAVLSSAAVTLLQLEIPIDAVVAAAEAAGGTVVLNPAPVFPLPAGLLERVGVLVLNRVELATLTEAPVPATIGDVEALVDLLPGGLRVVATLGADGALVSDGRERVHVPAVRVDAVDTTAAGDAFCAAIADALVAGASLAEATRRAVRVAGFTVTRAGAQDSLPRREEFRLSDQLYGSAPHKIPYHGAKSCRPAP
jgi:ribokinase